VTEAVGRMKRNGDVMRSDRLKQVMQEIDASFDEKNLGHPKFSRFVQEAQQRGLLKVTKLESGQLEIDMPEGALLPAIAASVEVEPRREDRESREERDRRGRRGRRGRGRERFDRDRDAGDGGAEVAAEGDTDAEGAEGVDQTLVVTAEMPLPPSLAAAIIEPEGIRPLTAEESAAEATAEAERGERSGRDRGRRRGRGRDRFRDRDRGDAAAEPEAASAAVAGHAAAGETESGAAAPQTFGTPVSDTIGRSGERLTRSDAFDLVRRAVESLVAADEATSASAARTRAFELLGRDSESLAVRMFERILQDAHDANLIDLRRRGDDWEVARAADAASIVEQLKSVDDAQKAEAKAAAALLPPAPRGMGARGIGPRGTAGRGKGPGGPPPELLMVGVVGARPVGAVAPAAAAPAPAPVAAPAPAAEPAADTPAPAAAATPPAETAPAKGKAAPAKKVPAKAAKAEPKAPAKAPAKAAKPAAKAPAKAAPKAPAKAPAKAAKPAAKAPAKAPAKAAKAPAKKAARKG
jgi:hypothetical protein